MSDPVACPICASEAISPLLGPGRTPIFQNAVYSCAEIAVGAATGTLAITGCLSCGFVWNAAFDASLIRYAGDYDNSQTHSGTFLRHLASRAERIISAIPADGPVEIVEIGCGQGDFLHRLAAMLPTSRRISMIGFDPAYRGGGTEDRRIRIFGEYFDDCSLSKISRPDVLISRHTIEHVPDPVAFLKAMIKALPLDSTARLFLETPDNTWILRNDAFQDFFYEHCSLFDIGSINRALRRAGFSARTIETCFGGQYLWVEAEARLGELVSFEDFAVRGDAFRSRWTLRLEQASTVGAVALWGAGAKGTTFALMMDPERRLIQAVVDSNPGKQGGFIAGSGHPIVAPESIVNSGINTILVMNPIYEAEIRSKLKELGSDAEVILLR